MMRETIRVLAGVLLVVAAGSGKSAWAAPRIELLRPLTHERKPRSFSSADGVAAIHSGFGFVTVLDMGDRTVQGRFQTGTGIQDLIVTSDQASVVHSRRRILPPGARR